MADNIDPAQIDELNQNLADLVQTLGGVSQTAGLASAANKQVASANKEAALKSLLLGQGLDKLGMSAVGLGKALYKGEKGAGVFGDAVEQAAGAVSLLILALGPFSLAAKIAAVAITAFAKGVNAAAKQGDALYKSYQDLARSGATASTGITGVFNNMQKFGYGIEELDKMVKLVSENSETLAKFSLTAADGTNAYASAMQDIVRDPALRVLGKMPEDITAAGASFIRQQVSMGRSQKDIGDNLGKSTRQYIMDLDRLQRLTGTSADVLQKQQEELQDEDAYLLYMEGLERQGEAGKAQADKIKEITAQFPQYSKMIAASIGGNIEAAQQLNFIAPSLMNNLRDPLKSTSDTIKSFGAEARNAKTAYSGLAQIGGGTRDVVGGFKDLNKAILSAADYDERNAAAARNAKITDEATENLSKIDLERMNSRDALQSFVQLGVAPATRAMAALAKGTSAATSVLPGDKTGAATGEGLVDRITKRITNLATRFKETAPTGLGSIARQFESAGAGAGTVSTGKGDYGGASYGLYQMSSKMGQVQKFLKENEKYGKEFEGLTAGTEDFNKKWKELGGEKGFAEAQQAFAKKQYYDAQVQTLGDLGKKLSGKGRGVQEALFSTGVQYGGASKLIEKALAGKDVDKMSDKDIINAIQDYKAQNVSTNFKSSSLNVQQSVAGRIERERAALTAVSTDGLAGQDKQKRAALMRPPTAGPIDNYKSEIAGINPSKTLPEKIETKTAANTSVAGNDDQVSLLSKIANYMESMSYHSQKTADSTAKTAKNTA